MPETFTSYDAADYLRTPAEMAEYLQASAEDGDPAQMAAALATIARAQNMSALARKAGLTREGLYKALTPGGNPGFGTMVKIASALGYGLAFRALAGPTSKAEKRVQPSSRASAA